MMLIDDRVGSVELAPYFRPYGTDVVVSRLDIADVKFVGNGPDGDVDVGIERKRLTDLLACIRDRRLSGFQLVGDESQPGLLESFDYVYLVVEGIYRPGLHGILEQRESREWRPVYAGSKAMMYSEMDNFLNSLELRAVTRIGEPLRVHRTGTIAETACWLNDLYGNWVLKTWKEHKAHQDIYYRVPEQRSRKLGFVKPKNNPLVKMIAQLDGVHSKAYEVAKRFKSIRRMANAGAGSWQQIDGIGKKLAKQIVEMIEKEWD